MGILGLTGNTWKQSSVSYMYNMHTVNSSRSAKAETEFSYEHSQLGNLRNISCRSPFNNPYSSRHVVGRLAMFGNRLI